MPSGYVLAGRCVTPAVYWVMKPWKPADVTRGRIDHRSEVRSAGGAVFWTEREGGKTRLAGFEAAPRRFAADHALAPGVGYGGGAFNLSANAAYYVAEGRLWRLAREGSEPHPLTPPFGAAADPQPDPGDAWVVYVHHLEGRDVLAITQTSGESWPQVLAAGADFYMQPAWSPNGRRLAWVEWDQPNMPWDGGRLLLAEFAGGRLQNVRQVAGGPATPVFQPLFSPDGSYLVWLENPEGEELDRLVRLDLTIDQKNVLLEDMVLLEPAWMQAQRVMSFGPGGALYLRENRGGRGVLWRVGEDGAREQPLPAKAAWLTSLSGDERGLAAVVSGPGLPHQVAFTDGSNWQTRAYGWPADGAGAVEPEAVSFKGADGQTIHAIYYPPAGGGANPPAVVSIHGGPTSQRTLAFDPQPQFFANNGFAYLELNYRGSTGYGRSYREALYGQWGVADVADAVAAARFLADSGRADGRRLAIIGGSAGGYTTLMTLATHPGVYRAGVSFFGVTDLFLLARNTHKFEARYIDKLVGPLPEAAALYRERSPLTHAGNIKNALYVFQGSEDRVVPLNQAEELVRVLQQNGVPHRYKVYEGEGHGWRKPETISDFYREMLAFLERMLKFG